MDTLEECTTRFTMLLHLPRMTGHGERRVKNGPALAGHGAAAMRAAIVATITTLPEQLRRSLDVGPRCRDGTTSPACTLTPACRSYSVTRVALATRHDRKHERPAAPVFSEGTDLGRHSADDRAAVAAVLNIGPRKTLGWQSTAEALKHHLLSYQEANVATTPQARQYLSIRYTERLAEAGAVTSVDSKGDSHENALAQTINGLYKTELIRRQWPWRTMEQVELATAEWVDWWNQRRLHSAAGNASPAEFEVRHQPPPSA